ncbi:MAG: hypothetical protein AAB913_01415 [Patescibacteria group bacterium]
MREERKHVLSQLRELAGKGERPVKQYKITGISESTYYRWMTETPELKQELARLLIDSRKAKIKEAALIGAPVSEQRLHANKLTEKEYNDIMEADPDFAEEVEVTKECNLKLWARKNIAESIQNNKNIPDSWRYLEQTEKDMNKTRLIVENNKDKEINEEDQSLLNEYEEKIRKNIRKRTNQLPDEENDWAPLDKYEDKIRKNFKKGIFTKSKARTNENYNLSVT